ncbi:MAG TPA: CHASE4 domain-containing protein [Steroidobacteraceae bacterium]|nr:CHASE4 domain-containing protein [Steroidobacteraceae bacterium]
MRVRAKVSILLALLLVVLIAAQWTIQQRLIQPRFIELEHASARTDMQRVELAVERELQSLGAAASDWGNWAEVWRYMRDHNRGFAQANLTDAAVQTLKVDYLAVLTRDGRYEWTRALDPSNGKRIAVQLNRSGQLEPPWLAALAQGATITGLIDTDQGVLLAAGAPILDGFNNGPVRGMVIVGRILDNAELQRIGRQAQVALDMRLWDKASDAHRDARLTETETTTRVEHAFANQSGRPLLVLGITVPRTISRQGAEAVRYSTLMLSLAGGVVLFALLVLLGRIVLNPLARMTDHAQRIAAADDLTQRLGYHRSDELGALAHAFDDMVGRLADSRRELADRSFESGAAEQASGVLHNLGNAMTPLSVNIAALRQHLHAMPVDDLQHTLEEFLRGTADAERQRDLRQFLELVARELANTRTQAREALARIVDQAEAIEAVLAEQHVKPRAGPVLQAITPAELIERSLARLDPARRARLEVRQAPGLAALGSLPLPGTTLAMVLQELAGYAAACAQQADQAHARLDMEAELLSSNAQRVLRLGLQQSSGGLDAAALRALFQKDPDAAGAGRRGLHWCANTLHALGGSIAAHSDGPGRGVRFEILLPLQS